MTALEITDLHADCSRCAALCCVLLPFRREGGFGADKAGGVACANLLADDRCGIHDRLGESGWTGCVAFDCFGAGQFVTERTYAGRSWRGGSADVGEMGAVLTVQRLLHEMLHHLAEVDLRAPDPEAAGLAERVNGLRALDPEALLGIDLDELHDEVGRSLRSASLRIRTPAGTELAYADLAGADLRDRDLCNADLRGATLIGADLRGQALRGADLLGADLRGADLRATDLADALFVTAAQLGGSRGDRTTTIAAWLRRPERWESPQIRDESGM